VTTPKGPLSYTVLPYIPDASVSCGQGSVDIPGTLDGVSIVAGHEVAETQTDPQIGSGWIDANGDEIADKCAWFNLQNTQFAAGSSYPTQPLWSNATSSCVQSYTAPSPSPSPTPVVTPTAGPTPTPLATPTPQPTPTPKQATNLVRNASFDDGRLHPWRTCRSSNTAPRAFVTTVDPHSGNYDAYAGTLKNGPELDGTTSLCQSIVIPDGAHLTLWMRGVSDDHRDGVFQFIRLYDASGTLAKTLFKDDVDEKTWHQRSFDLTAYADRRYLLAIGVKGKPDGRHIGQYVDDVSIR
jgi:hypothetical protein